jgi:hypothetical protein
MPPSPSPQAAHVQREITFDGSIRRGDRGKKAGRVQEWLTFHRCGTAIDGDFGAATERSVAAFQKAQGLGETGVADEETWERLIAPLRRALAPIEPAAGEDLATVVLRYAKQHVAQHPVELGGDNRGPWVRVYMGGNQGSEWRWCAGFVTFLLREASKALGRPMPISGSFSCDSLAFQARDAGLFVKGTEVEAGTVGWPALGECQIFLVRRTPTDWVHTGLSFDGRDETFSTFEGNTNDSGSSNGFEACRRVRALGKKDFIRLA